MLFNSSIYIFLLLPIAVAGYFELNRRRLTIASKVWLVLVSLFFYSYWNPAYLWIIIASILFNYSLGRKLLTLKQDPGTAQQQKYLLATGIIANVSLLAYFKYTDFFIGNINWIAGENFSLFNLTLPLAISFFTFQQIAYLVDCYKEKTRVYSFVDYCLFVTFFPQLISGPIVHHNEMMPQFSNPRRKLIDWKRFSMGVFIFSLGFTKKVWIADTFGGWANSGFDSTQALSLIDAWGTSLSYTLQLYFDFSGYTDMAIGSALLFNIYLPINFNSPYKAQNIRDFWRRWHITLSRWLRDYIYIPLGGNRASSNRTLINVLATFLIGGLWHGASWTFIAWGAMHGLALCILRLWQQTNFRLPTSLAWLITFLFINTTWVFFRAEDFSTATAMIHSMANLNGTIESTLFSAKTWIYIIVFSAIAFMGSNSLELAGYHKNSTKSILNHTAKFLIAQSTLLALMFFAALYAKPSEFLYFNF